MGATEQRDDAALVVTPRVSVIIPSRDRPSLVRHAVKSVLDQNDPLEIIIIDDGSEPALSADGLLGDPRVTIIRNDVPQGPTQARNIGLRASSGSFVAFLDDDDVWLPGKLRRSLGSAPMFPEARVIVHRTAFVMPTSADASPSIELVYEPLRLLGITQTPHLDGVIVDGDLARDVEFDEDFDAAQDVDFVIELARRSPFVMIDAVLAVHGTYDAPSFVNLDRRIAARKRLRDKHSDVMYCSHRSRSFYHVRLAHLYRRQNKRGEAWRGFARALRHDPLNGLAWRGMAATVMPSQTVHWMSRRRANGET